MLAISHQSAIRRLMYSVVFFCFYLIRVLTYAEALLAWYSIAQD